MLSKTKFMLKYMLVALTLMMYSCQEDHLESPSAVDEQSFEVFKDQLEPLAYQALPEEVQKQLDLTRENLDKYMQSDLQLVSVEVLGRVATKKVADMSHRVIADQENVVASGNIMDPSSVNIGKMQDIYAGKALTDTRSNIREIASKEIKAGDNVLEITWQSGNETFKSQCFYRNTGVVWDNVLTGLIMMDPAGEEETSANGRTNDQSRLASSWYKRWWTANWLWGSKRGQMGYRITVYYSGSWVSNTDVNDWGYISLGKARSESKIVKNSGSYGKCRYALGLCTPVGSLSFSHSNFSVSFSGLGSNVVANGYKSRYP